MSSNASFSVWFGFVRVERPGWVCIVDNLSGTEMRFKLPTDDDVCEGKSEEDCIISDVGATDQFVFVLSFSKASLPQLYAYELGTEGLFRVSVTTDEWSPLGKSNCSFQCKPSTSSSSADALIAAQFSHWQSNYCHERRQRFSIQIANRKSEATSRHLLKCTAFEAFLLTNTETGKAILKRIHSSRSDKQQVNCSTSSLWNLPFSVQKLSAGRDHLAMLDATKGEIWMLGTGTRGELGTGHVEADNWKEGPSRLERFVEAHIRCVDVQSGGWHTVALTEEGDVYGWGWNGHGQLGQASSEFSIQPTPFPFEFGDERAIAIHCDSNSTFILLGDGTERTFGEIEQDEEQAKEMSSPPPKEEKGSNETEERTLPDEDQKPDIKHLLPAEGGDSAIAQSNSSEENDEKSAPTPKRQRQQRMMNLAVAGCSHGQMDTIYGRLIEVQRQRGITFDLLICCGDFQAIRNHGDLHHYHAPIHHRKLGTFYKYYSGEKVAPVLTLFVGGNHESSGYMAELPNGGWVAPNIYYMGYASVVHFGGLRIAGLSGIFKPGDYNKGHFERPPFQEHGSIVSAYHVRSVEIFRLRQLRGSPLDIFISHDWPAGITDFGDRDRLLRIKPHFVEDVMNNRLGNPATMNLIHELRPRHWFAAHMHVHFTAVVPHSDEQTTGSDHPMTHFLALDKPNDNPRRRFIEFLQIPIAEEASLELSYDPHWLSILRATDELTDPTNRIVYMPSNPNLASSTDRKADLQAVLSAFEGDLRIPLNFQQTAPPEIEPWSAKRRPSLYYRNPQTQQFCERLGIRDMNLLFAQASVNFLGIPHFLSAQQAQHPAAQEGSTTNANPDEINLDDDEFGSEDFIVDVQAETSNRNEKCEGSKS